MTMRKAWELLSLVDQIHLWGVTDFRSSITQYLKQWHEFSRMCYANDVMFLIKMLKTDRFTQDGKEYLSIPKASLQLADWVEHVTEETREKLQKRAMFHFRESYQREFPASGHSWPEMVCCVLGDCCPVGHPGYPLLSKEEMIAHYREIHGRDDDLIASFERCLDMEESDNSNNTRQIQKKRSASGEPRPYTKRFKGSTSKDFGDIHCVEIIDLTED